MLFRYNKKYFLVCLSILFVLESYAMDSTNRSSAFDDEKSINATREANIRLFEAVKNAESSGYRKEEDWKEIKTCIENGANPDCYNLGGKTKTVLVLAILHSNKDMFDYLINRQADVNASDMFGFTPLHAALQKLEKNSESFDIKVLQELLECKANPNVQVCNSEKATPLILAAKVGNTDAINLLVNYSANINYEDSYNRSPLGWAIENRNLKAVERLCDAGASVMISEKSTAFHMALIKGEEFIEQLITHARFDSQEEMGSQGRDEKVRATIMGALLAFNRLGIDGDMQLLILSKLPPNHFQIADKTVWKRLFARGCRDPFIFALVNKRIARTKEILHIKNSRGLSPLETVLYSNRQQCPETVEDLLDGSKLQEDFNNFNAVFPNIFLLSRDNLVLQMYCNCRELMLNEERKKISHFR